MHLIPLALGVTAVLIGIGMVGYGIPINEFGTGNTLIAAGTTAMVGGFILLGLWAAVVQLRRLEHVLEPRSRVAVREGSAPEAARARQRPQPEPHPGEPSFPVEPEGAFGGSAPLPDVPQAVARGPGEERPVSRGEEEASALAIYAPSRSASRERGFDSIWPSERRPPSTPEPKPGEDRRAPAPGSAGAPGPQAAAILKSGVINGMAYTLYTDGSIEAELAQGMVRFGSIEELRAYLADQG
jgi:hypothetical protein